MTLAARTYITVNLLLGAAAIARGFYLWDAHDPLRFLCYLALAIPASSLKVRLPGITGTMSVLFLFLLAGIMELSLSETLIIALACSLVGCFWHTRVRPRLIQIFFSFANLSIATSGAEIIYNSSTLASAHVQIAFRLGIAASLFFALNTFPVATVIALTEGKSIRRVWAQCYAWSFPYYLVGAACVGLFSFANRRLDWEAWILILPVVYVIYRSYHLYLDRLDSEHRQADEHREHAEEITRLQANTEAALVSAVSANTKLDAVIEASPLAIFGLDVTGRITLWNTRAEHMLGWSSEELLGNSLPFPGKQCNQVIRSAMDRTLQGGGVSGLDVTQVRRDGTSFEASIWTAPLYGPGGTTGVLVTVADVSDRKRLEEQLRTSQKMEAIGRLAGGIAHDFNNLLMIINGYGSMLVEESRDNPYICSQAEEIVHAGQRAAELVSQLLTFSRRQVNKPRPIDVNQLVGDVEKMLARVIGEHIQFRIVLDHYAGWIAADPMQMETALMNLASNARDAMPDGGTLSMETARVDVRAGQDTEQHDLPPGSYVRVMVADTGQGMDAETQQHLFEPFFTTKERGKGTGLGLSSVYGVVKQNGGHIQVSTELGKGSTFSIYLPRLQATAPASHERVELHSSCRGTETVLLVEDETGVRGMLREALSNAGYRVLEASSGNDAVEQWGRRLDEIQLLVTDVVMPGMNGFSLADELRGRSGSLNVIVMSGHTDEMISRQGVLDAALEYLPKPFAPEVLVRKVRETLDRARVDFSVPTDG